MEIAARCKLDQVQVLRIDGPNLAQLAALSGTIVGLHGQEILSRHLGNELVLEQDLEQHTGRAVDEVANLVGAGKVLKRNN